MINNRITKIFEIKFPVIQGGMVWCSGWELVSAVSNSGGLGLLGAGSMYPDVLRQHIQKVKKATNKPFGVNVPLMYPQINDLMTIILEEKVPVVFTSAGNPNLWTKELQKNGCKVGHVVASGKFAIKCQDAGVDTVVAEGFEAGGHNGKEETTTMCLIPSVRKAIEIPLIAAGGIFNGATMLAAFSLGAEGVQVGSRFAATKEASCHDSFKELIISAKEGDTMLRLKKIGSVRLLQNKFADLVSEAEDRGADSDELKQLLGRGRAKLGMFEGNTDDGELEIGQVSASIDSVLSVKEVMDLFVNEYNEELKRLWANGLIGM